MAQYHSPKEYLEEARSATTSPERLEILAETEWEFVRAAVAANPNTNVRTLVGLLPTDARSKDESIAVAIARRADAPPEALRQLAERFGRTVDWSGRSIGFELGLALLNNPATPDDAIAMLLDAAHTTAHFRARVASTTSRADVLARLCRDVSEKVQKRAKHSLMNCENGSKTSKPRG